MKFKHLIYPLIIVQLLSCSNPNEQSEITTTEGNKTVEKTVTSDNKMKQVVTNFLEQNLPDFKSYESIEWSKIDTVYDDYSKTDKGQREKKMMDSVVSEIDHYTLLDGNIESGLYYGSLDNSDSLRIVQLTCKSKKIELSNLHTELIKQYDYNEQHQKDGVIVGYRIDHKFRSNTRSGIMNIGRLRFFTDTNFNLIKSIDLDDYERRVNEFGQSVSELIQ